MDDKKTIDSETLAKLEETKKAVLKRVAKNLLEQSEQGSSVSAGHSSHSSGGGRTHSSVVTS
jgi:hypothetical protein